MRKFIAIFFILVGIFSTTSPVFACPTPDYLKCDELGSGYQFSFGVKPAQDGTYIFVNTINTRLFGGAPVDVNNSVTISNSDLRTFDWSATLGIDAVIVQAGRQSTVRYYDENLSGTGVYGALEPGGRPYQIDKVYFCYDYELAVAAEAKGTASGGSGTWDITKSVADAEKTAFAGESAAFDYTVAATVVAGGEGSSFSLETTVTITNNTPLTAVLVGGSAVLNPGNIDLMPAMECLDAPLTFPIRISPSGELVCTATTALESQVEGTVTVEIRTSGNVGGASATDEIEWSGTGGGGGGYNSVTVTDTNAAFGGPYTISESRTWNYSVDLACPVDPAAYADGPVTVTLDNTAAITETGQSASQSVALVCYAPTVSTSANASYNVQYVWEITKASLISNLQLEEFESTSVDYTATVDVASTVQTDATVAGSVTVGNPRPDAPMTVAVVDEIALGIPVLFSNCTSPVTIPAGGSVTCNFTTTVEILPSGNNTAMVTLNGITFTATAPFDNTGMTEIDECITVYDTAFTEPLGVVCANQAPYVFPYSVTIGPYEGACRDTSYVNTASFITNDTGAEGYDTNILDIRIKCPVVFNCVRTIQYWLNHSDPNDPEYNPTWDQVGPSGPSSPFFTTGWTWVQALGMSSSSSTYLRLAQAYIAAKLNTLYGALPNETVSTNIARAEVLLAQYATSQNLVTGAVATEFRNVTTVLGNFNRGVTGVPVCVDCNDRLPSRIISVSGSEH